MLKRKTLKILDWSVHSPHQYELSKLGHNHFFLREGQRYPWNWKMRPCPKNFYFIGECDPSKFDLIIAHNPHHLKIISEWKNKGVLDTRVPLVYMFHFSSRDEVMKQSMRRMLGDYAIIFNSYSNQLDWGLSNRLQRTIIHGFDIDDWPQWQGGINGVLNIAGAMKSRSNVTGYDLWKSVGERIGYEKFFLMGGYGVSSLKPWMEGRVRESENWDDLKQTMQSTDVYFSPTKDSPFPRARSEAFVTGMPMVCTTFHDSNIYIQHEINAFRAESSDECVYYINLLLQDKDLRIKFSNRARETAREVLSGERYRKEWCDFLDEVLS